ncbi:MAG: restriction endonuclease subunit S [Bacteroidetes bacterium]|nr:restriction endonuclease subunit S [Bacteroidota bacterium]
MNNTATYNKSAWLGNYPAHWKVLRIKNCASINQNTLTEQTGLDYQFNYLDIANVNSDGEVLEIQKMSFKDAPSRARRIVNKDDIVISTVRTYLKAIALIGNDFDNLIASTGFAVLKSKGNINPKYLYYALNSKIFIHKVMINSFGVTYPAITPTALNCLSIPVPPLTEQTQIANYLDTQSQKINHFIAKKQQFITLLKEQRQSVINTMVSGKLLVVSGKLEAPKKVKDSGIKWLGNIPEHWEVRKLRYCGHCQNGLNKGGEFFGTGYPFYGYGDIYNNEILPVEPSGLVMSSVNDRDSCSVQEGDVFFTRTSEIVEEIAIASTCFTTVEDATFSGFLIRFRPIKDIIDKTFSAYYFRCQLLRAFFVKEMNIITRASMSQDLLKNLSILIPPLEEQKDIANHIKTETATIDTAIAKTEREIELIKEYKEAMIAEAVMGKIVVSG